MSGVQRRAGESSWLQRARNNDDDDDDRMIMNS